MNRIGLLAVLLAAGVLGGELGDPVRIEAGGKPIDAAGGHAAPSIADLDGDGVPDLLVGQFLPEGKTTFGARMRLYRNLGKDGAPSFRDAAILEGGGDAACVPSG